MHHGIVSAYYQQYLFSGSISDNEICHERGFYVLLKQLKEMGCIQDNDGIMADKGFHIEKDLQELKLKLNIPPFASSASQMSDKILVTFILQEYLENL
jgi:hypothetical protein